MYLPFLRARSETAPSGNVPSLEKKSEKINKIPGFVNNFPLVTIARLSDVSTALSPISSIRFSAPVIESKSFSPSFSSTVGRLLKETIPI